MSFISINKQTIAQNNKAGWVDPAPAIRVAEKRHGPGEYGHNVAIKDANGKVVAVVCSSRDGEPLLKCGAKIVIETLHEAEIMP